MNTIQEIQQAIRQLSRFQREDLAEWILNSADFADRVAEASLAYEALAQGRYLSVDEYLQSEEGSPIRHEYVAGQIFAMSGGTLRHKAISDNLLVSFSNHLRGSPCRAVSSSMKVRLRVNADEIFYYPDAMVACGLLDMDSVYLTNPCLIVEVLSPSTEAVDRREKALNYRHIESLEEYVQVAQRPLQVAIFRRSKDWIPVVLTTPDAVAEFRSIALSMTLEQLYEGTQ